MKSKLYFFLLTALMGLFGMNAWAQDLNTTYIDGVEYYEISNADDLVTFAQIVNNGEVSANAVLTDDIDCSTIDEWTPIGNSGDTNEDGKYHGTFDGQGHTISNLVFTMAGNAGIFDTTGGFTLKNFIVDSSCSITTTNNCAGLIGRHQSKNSNLTSTISGVGMAADVKSTGGENPAGLIGGCWGKKDVSIIIEKCWTSGTITSSDSKKGNTGAFVGWINGGKLLVNDSWSIATVNTAASDKYLVRPANNTNTSVTFNNCYSLNGTQVVKLEGVTAADLSTGVITYAVNGMSSENPIWFQTLGTDPYPVADNTHSIVYLNGRFHCDGTAADGVVYSNENLGMVQDPHTSANGICTVCGALTDENYMTPNGEGIFEIATAHQLRWFAAYVNARNASANAVLTDDIDMTDVDWIPIGKTVAYGGTFDGQNRVISNFNYIGSGDYNGLFGKIIDATVKNFFINGTLVCAGQGSGAIGWGEGAFISNVHSGLTIETPATGAVTHAGGVMGDTHYGGSVGGTTVQNCSFTGTLTVNADSHDCFGGITGYANNYCKFENCANYGTIYFAKNNCYIGGIIGYINNNNCYGAHNCLNVGNVIYTGEGDPTYGGAIVGRLRSHDPELWGNSYYLAGSAVTANGENQISKTIEVTAEQLASGEVCYALNGNQSENVNWYQNLEEDNYPLLSGTYVVYPEGRQHCDGTPYTGVTGYSNTPNVQDAHDFIDGFCTYCGTINEDYIIPNGEGSFEIGTAIQLKWFAAYANQIDHAANAILTADINLDGIEWTPIGNGSVAYEGTFDGQGYAITNFSYTASSDNNGLFGKIDNAKVKNFSISGTLTSDGFNYNGLIGQAEGTSVVSSIYSSMNITVSNFKAHTGGIVGGCTTSSKILVESCEYAGTLTHSGTGDCQAGILGYTYGGGVKNCIFSGTIIGENNKYGGIMGYCKAPGFQGIQNCLSIGKIIANEGCTTAAAIIANWNGDATENIKNNYYRLQDGSTTTIAIGNHPERCEVPIEVTAEQLASGEVTAKLGIAFRQNIGSDEAPVLDPTHNVVAKITEAGYATLFIPDTDLTIPAGVEANTGAILNEGWLHLNAIEGDAIAAGEPVVLKGNAGIYSFVPTTGAEKVAGNVLKGTAEDTAAAGKYVLAKPDGAEKAGFYLANNGTIKAGKAYLEADSEVKAFFFDGDDATGIENLNNQNTLNTPIYNLAGQRMSKMHKGINIVDGKKILK